MTSKSTLLSQKKNNTKKLHNSLRHISHTAGATLLHNEIVDLFELVQRGGGRFLLRARMKRTTREIAIVGRLTMYLA